MSRFFITVATSKVHLSPNQSENFKSYAIPKIIWSYWDSETKPKFIENCIKSWKKYNPSFEIHILNQNNYKKYISSPLNYKNFEQITRFADFLRFQLLSEHGGIWIDASIICNESLDWVVDQNEYEFVGYYTPNFTTIDKYPVIENWFLASSKKSYFMQKWNKEVQSIKNFKNVENYIDSLRNQGIDLQNIPFPEYLMCHAALMKVFQSNSDNSFKINVISSVGDNGPFRYLSVNNWESEIALQSLCINTDNKTPLIKIRGDERKKLEKNEHLNNQVIDCVFDN